MNWAKVLKKITRINAGIDSFGGANKPVMNWKKLLSKICRLNQGVKSFTGDLKKTK